MERSNHVKGKVRLIGGLLVVALVGAACGGDDKTPTGQQPQAAKTGANTPAAKTRVALDQLLGEHVVLAAAATGAALGGRTAEFNAAVKALDANSRDVAAAVAGPLKKTTDQAYEFWNSHIGMFVAYTQATAKKDKAGQDKAVNDLVGYAKSFGTLVNGAIPALPANAVEQLVTDHILSLKAAVDAQAAKDFKKAGSDLHAAYMHMDMIAKALAGSLGLEGKADSPAADVHSALTSLLGEHVVAAAMATGAALGGRTKEFEAYASGILETNSRAIADAVAGPLKKTPEQAYEFWNSHIGMFVAYTQATAKKDKAGQAKAVNDLVGYATSFGTLVNGAIPSLPADAVEGLVKEHILTLKDAVDAQAKKDFDGAFTALRKAYSHMDMIGSALAEAVAG